MIIAPTPLWRWATHCIGDHWSSRFIADNIVQMFDDGSVLGTNISQTLEHRFVCAHWRQNHAFGTVLYLSLATFYLSFHFTLDNLFRSEIRGNATPGTFRFMCWCSLRSSQFSCHLFSCCGSTFQFTTKLWNRFRFRELATPLSERGRSNLVRLYVMSYGLRQQLTCFICTSIAGRASLTIVLVYFLCHTPRLCWAILEIGGDLKVSFII